MQTLGDYLKKGREAQNISLSDVSDYTKISKIYLDCLENDEYTKIPAEPYVKGYISSYAGCVGIDEHEALKLYDSFRIDTNDAEDIKSEILEDKKNSKAPFLLFNKKTWLVLSFSVLVILAIGVSYSFFSESKKASADKSFEEPNKSIQPSSNSTIELDLPQKRQDRNSFQSRSQIGFEKKIEKKEIRKKPGNGISQIPAPLESHRPEQNSTKGVPYPPINEFSRVKDLPGSENDQTQIEYNLKVVEAIACSNIINRLPQGSGDYFEWSLDRIYIWSRIRCERPPSSIRHIYYYRGEKVNDILLKIHSSNWRTWSYKTLSNKRYIGPWRVDITSVDGKLLQSIKFEIK